MILQSYKGIYFYIIARDVNWHWATPWDDKEILLIRGLTLVSNEEMKWL